MIQIENIKITYSLKGESPFPNSNDKELHYHYKIRLTYNDKYALFDYYTSIRDKQQGINYLDEKNQLFALRAILDDSSYAYDSFNDFCNNLGYSNDSIQASKIYKTIQKNTQKLQRIGIDQNKITDILNKLDEMEIN